METMLPSLVRGGVYHRPPHTGDDCERPSSKAVCCLQAPPGLGVLGSYRILTDVQGSDCSLWRSCWEGIRLFILGIKGREGGPRADCGWEPGLGLLKRLRGEKQLFSWA